MDPSFIYEAKGQILIIHMPKELDHHNCRNLRYETDLLMAENYISKLIFDFSRTTFMDSSGIGILLNRYK
ncbi:MAG: STAS domain-containing protein, partial [Lachnospiraceae bacterium]|nr:STAS domain-containing protein [Lachnospiraceae bacterium]